MKKHFFIAIIIICLFSFLSCKKNDENEIYTVTFNLMEGEYNEKTQNVEVRVQNGKTVECFTPVKTGYIFSGWTTKLEQLMVPNFTSETKVKNNTVVYAIWRRPQLTLNADGGKIVKYQNVDALIDEFLEDFAIHCGWYVSANDFFWAGFNNTKKFLIENNTKWTFIFNYLYDNTPVYNRNKFDEFLAKNEQQIEEDNNVRAEIEAFLCKTVNRTYNGRTYYTADYSNVDVQNKIWNYIDEYHLSFYSSNVDFELPYVYKEGFTFEGWYESASFDGERVTVIKKGDPIDRTYFAKFS